MSEVLLYPTLEVMRTLHDIPSCQGQKRPTGHIPRCSSHVSLSRTGDEPRWLTSQAGSHTRLLRRSFVSNRRWLWTSMTFSSSWYLPPLNW